MSNQASMSMVPRGSRLWAVVRLGWLGALAVAAVIGAARQDDAAFGYLGGLTGMALLEMRFMRERRHPFFTLSGPRIDAVMLLLVVVNLVVVIWLIVG